MSGESARVESIDALRLFRIALFKFAEAADTALNDADAELSQTLNWLENEQFSFWQTQIRKRHELVERAKEAVRMKKMFKDSSGRSPTAVEEEKALRIAQVRLAEAEQKLVNTRKYSRVLQREIQSYKGSTQRLQTSLAADIPVAAATLDKLMATLEQYMQLSPTDTQTAPPESQPAPPPEQEDDTKDTEA